MINLRVKTLEMSSNKIINRNVFRQKLILVKIRKIDIFKVFRCQKTQEKELLRERIT